MRPFLLLPFLTLLRVGILPIRSRSRSTRLALVISRSLPVRIRRRSRSDPTCLDGAIISHLRPHPLLLTLPLLLLSLLSPSPPFSVRIRTPSTRTIRHLPPKLPKLLRALRIPLLSPLPFSIRREFLESYVFVQLCVGGHQDLC